MPSDALVLRGECSFGPVSSPVGDAGLESRSSAL